MPTPAPREDEPPTPKHGLRRDSLRQRDAHRGGGDRPLDLVRQEGQPLLDLVEEVRGLVRTDGDVAVVHYAPGVGGATDLRFHRLRT